MHRLWRLRRLFGREIAWKRLQVIASKCEVFFAGNPVCFSQTTSLHNLRVGEVSNWAPVTIKGCPVLIHTRFAFSPRPALGSYVKPIACDGALSQQYLLV